MGRKSRNKKLRKVVKFTDKGVPLITRKVKPVKISISNKFKNTISFLKQGFTKRFLISILFTAGLVIVYFLFGYKKGGYINGNTIFVGSTTFSYNNSQIPDSNETRISPLCGCLINHPHRGVEFFSKSFNLISEYPNDTTSATQYFITSPAQNMYFDPHFYFKSKIYFFNKELNNYSLYETAKYLQTRDTGFSSLDKSGLSIKKNNIVNTLSCDTTSILNIITKANKLHFEILGEFPIAALIPVKSSSISVIKEHLNNFKPESDFYIQESFTRKDTNTMWEFPMLDVLGPQIAISCTPDMIILDKNKYHLQQLGDSIKSCIILLDVGFQARITQNKFDTFFRRISDTVTNFALNTIEYEGNSYIEPKPLNNIEFAQLKKKIDSAGMISSAARIIGTNYEMTGWGLPELSEHNGIYFYGQHLSNIKCDEAIGVCQYGNKSYRLEPSRKIEIKELEDFYFYDEPIITPVSYNPHSNFSTKYKGKGKLYIDDSFVGESILDKQWFSELLIILGLVTGLISLFEYYKGLIRKAAANKSIANSGAGH